MRDPRRNPDKPFLYVDISAIDRDLKVITSAPEILGADAPSRARKEIYEGDVLVSTVRPNLNAVAVVPSKLDGHIASTGFLCPATKQIDHIREVPVLFHDDS
jgi:type I restriction enzyme S subunit